MFWKGKESIKPPEPQLSTSHISKAKQLSISEEASSPLVPPSHRLSSNHRQQATSGSVQLSVNKTSHLNIIWGKLLMSSLLSVTSKQSAVSTAWNKTVKDNNDIYWYKNTNYWTESITDC
jgi:hypothetical protein